MAHGVVRSGCIEYNGGRVDATGAVVYAEKNWGSSFPSQWWWVQANAFQRHPDLTVTAVGARRLIVTIEETIGMIAIHYNGLMYEFSNWSCDTLTWNVAPWGRWEAFAKSKTGYRATLHATSADKPVSVLGPTRDGMAPSILDSPRGLLTVTLTDAAGVVLLDRVSCDVTQVEVGGGPWEAPWVAKVRALPQPLRGAINLFNGPKVRTSR